MRSAKCESSQRCQIKEAQGDSSATPMKGTYLRFSSRSNPSGHCLLSPEPERHIPPFLFSIPVLWENSSSVVLLVKIITN